MCSTGTFQYRWLKRYVYSSCCYYHQIGSIHLSHCYHIFPWLCVWDVCYTIFCYLLHIHSGKTGNLFSLSLCSLWWVQIVRYVLTWRSYSLFVHYTISLSSLCKLIWRQWTHKMPIRYSLSSVWVRLGIFSQLSITKHVGLCVSSWPISLVMIERIYILCLIIIIESEAWTITHCLGLGHETMVCAACLSVFFKAPSHWCFWRESTSDRKMSPFNDVIMLRFIV